MSQAFRYSFEDYNISNRSWFLRICIRSLDNLKLKIEQQSFIMSLLFVLNNFMRKRDMAKSKDRISDCDKGHVNLPYRIEWLTPWRTAVVDRSLPVHYAHFCAGRHTSFEYMAPPLARPAVDVAIRWRHRITATIAETGRQVPTTSCPCSKVSSSAACSRLDREDVCGGYGVSRECDDVGPVVAKFMPHHVTTKHARWPNGKRR